MPDGQLTQHNTTQTVGFSLEKYFTENPEKPSILLVLIALEKNDTKQKSRLTVTHTHHSHTPFIHTHGNHFEIPRSFSFPLW